MSSSLPVGISLLSLCSATRSLTEAKHLRELFAKPNYNIVNELDGSSEPSLFDC